MQNFDWLEEKLGDVDDDYILFDCPGMLKYVVATKLLDMLHEHFLKVAGKSVRVSKDFISVSTY